MNETKLSLVRLRVSGDAPGRSGHTRRRRAGRSRAAHKSPGVGLRSKLEGADTPAPSLPFVSLLGNASTRPPKPPANA